MQRETGLCVCLYIRTPLTSMSTQQEEDLDTCYSSGPSLCLAGLARSGEGRDHARFYATTLKTGHGILFWVAQVVMPGLNLTGRLSFETVLLHGLLCDGGGHKTSKSWGNVINPLDVISGASLEVLCERMEGSLNTEEVLTGIRRNFPTGIPECGADALWFTLCSTNFNMCRFAVNLPEGSRAGQQVPQSRLSQGCVMEDLPLILIDNSCALPLTGNIELP
ncbi:hypothetical protein O3P69_002911 [Scylla paramamosain]|uniref:valine--tRNA ligase n=1 Tax=Scylla paramamosain TaxID=85552 RepID=A0AAW0UJN4_SCYPA